MKSIVGLGGRLALVLIGLTLLHAEPAFAAARGARAAKAARSSEPAAQTPPPGSVKLEPSGDGQTVHESGLDVTWLADANLAAKEKFAVAGINADGSMDYPTALKWVAAMNAAGYLGHKDWTLPTTPALDKGCNSHKNNDFGFGCTVSAMGSLYALALGLHWPASVVPASNNPVGPFKHLQPNLYWTSGTSQNDKNGYGTFSFNNGLQGSNVDQNTFFVLPMIKGKLPGTPAASGKELQVNPGGETVYDPVADVTFAADADLALTEKFGGPLQDARGVANFNQNGGMTHAAALAWIKGMNSGKGYLGHTNWELPPISKPGAKDQCGSGNSASGCADNPLGELFYGQLHLGKGQPVTASADIKLGGGLHDIQPYLYWSCQGDAGQSVCSTSKPLPAPGFGASFNFGDGFQGSDLEANNLYVMVYYPDPAPAHPAAPATGTRGK